VCAPHTHCSVSTVFVSGPCIQFSSPPRTNTPTVLPIATSPCSCQGCEVRAEQLVALRQHRLPLPPPPHASCLWVLLGVVVDAARGLVVVDRNTVPVAVGDVLVTVAASIEIPAKIVFLHPIHNFAVIQYNVEAIGDTPMRSAALSSTPVAVRVHAVGVAFLFAWVWPRSLWCLGPGAR
jgi:hypothetical protein